ncbi:50S ribosomal protein L20 [Patescibacteria group bacterium]|nr:50S ribosomal protein L20 [Patescibacteria group bacterium]
MRVKGGTTTRARHKKVLKSTKGYRGRQKNTFRVAKQANMKAGLHAYRGRKLKKRTYRALWIQRLNAAVRATGLTYSRFIDGLTKSKIAVNRKNLSELAINKPEVFAKIVNVAKEKASSPTRK